MAIRLSGRWPGASRNRSGPPEEAERFRGYWRTWGDHLPLEIVVSPYRADSPLRERIESAVLNLLLSSQKTAR